MTLKIEFYNELAYLFTFVGVLWVTSLISSIVLDDFTFLVFLKVHITFYFVSRHVLC